MSIDAVLISGPPFESPPVALRGPAARWAAARSHGSDPFQAAVAAGIGSVTIGEAFFAGYQAAVERMTGEQAVQSLLVNEPPSSDADVPPGHPRAIRTDVVDGRVSGTKAFALEAAEVYWVLVRSGPVVDGRIPFGLARVEASAEGVARIPMPVSWLQDVPHCAVTFRNARTERVHPDAWSRFVRRFRTVEDLGVLAAVVAARLGSVSRHPPGGARRPDEEEDWLAQLVALEALWKRVGEEPGDDATRALDPLVVRSLAGIRSRVISLFDTHPPVGLLARTWASDVRLFGIGGAPRDSQLQTARRQWTTSPATGRDPAPKP